MKNSIFVCQNPVGAHWQLGQTSLPKNNLILIGWRVSPVPVDAGVPAAVAEVLARTMTSAARVVFPCSRIERRVSNVWESNGDDLIRRLDDVGRIRRVWDSLFNTPSDVTLISTRRTTTAELLFDDEVYPWWMQGQIVLLCEPTHAAPEIDKEKLFALFEDDWIQRAECLRDIGVNAVLRPGTDGDLAGLLSFTETFKNNLLTAAERESRSAGFDWKSLSEDDFAEHLANRN